MQGPLRCQIDELTVMISNQWNLLVVEGQLLLSEETGEVVVQHHFW